MRTRVLLSLALVGLASVATTVDAAADGIAGSLKDAPLPVEEYVWGGAYVGIVIGGRRFDRDIDIDVSKSKEIKKRDKHCYGSYCPWEVVYDKTISDSFNFSDDDWSLFGTVQIGYDRLIRDRFLIGVFADFDFGGDSGGGFSDTWADAYKDIATISGKLDIDDVWSIGGRLGILITKRILLYGVGGYTEASLDGDINVDFNYGPTLTIAAPDDLQGYFFGGGVELKLRKNVSLKFEYRLSDYDGSGGSDSDQFKKEWEKYGKEYKLTKDFRADADFDAEVHSIRAVLALKLGDVERPIEPLK